MRVKVSKVTLHLTTSVELNLLADKCLRDMTHGFFGEDGTFPHPFDDVRVVLLWIY